MKIVSWDVGIKNLAYCVMEKSENNDRPYKIYNWGIINVIETFYLKCNGKDCNKKCLYYNIIDGKQVGYCALHKRFVNLEIPEPIKLTDKQECKFIGRKKCTKQATFSINNECYCTQHKKSILAKITKNQTLVKYKPPNCNTIDIKKLKVNMINLLDTYKDILLDVDHVVIENQPSLKNPKMKSVAETLYAWFLLRGQIDSPSPIKNLTYMCPSNKLKVNNDNTLCILKKSKNDTEKYKLTKQLGIIYCKQLLKNDDEHLLFLNNIKKKDDLCDAFLQGAYYIEFKL